MSAESVSAANFEKARIARIASLSGRKAVLQSAWEKTSLTQKVLAWGTTGGGAALIGGYFLYVDMWALLIGCSAEAFAGAGTLLHLPEYLKKRKRIREMSSVLEAQFQALLESNGQRGIS